MVHINLPFPYHMHSEMYMYIFVSQSCSTTMLVHHNNIMYLCGLFFVLLPDIYCCTPIKIKHSRIYEIFNTFYSMQCNLL